MSFEAYIDHYTARPGIWYMILISTLILGAARFILHFGKKENEVLRCEKYYELVLSSSAILLFTGMYFLIDYHYLSVPSSFYRVWDEYSDFILLAALIMAIVITNIFDHLLIPMKVLGDSEKASLRIAAIIYMLVVFGYIKFIYLDNNYDDIIVYFIIMIIGRFVYFDASFRDFKAVMKGFFGTLPILLLALASTALLALYGFNSGYLLKKNGVVLSLYIAHLYVIIEMIFLSAVERLIRFIHEKKKQKEEADSENEDDRDDDDQDESREEEYEEDYEEDYDEDYDEDYIEEYEDDYVENDDGSGKED